MVLRDKEQHRTNSFFPSNPSSLNFLCVQAATKLTTIGRMAVQKHPKPFANSHRF